MLKNWNLMSLTLFLLPSRGCPSPHVPLLFFSMYPRIYKAVVKRDGGELMTVYINSVYVLEFVCVCIRVCVCVCETERKFYVVCVNYRS